MAQSEASTTTVRTVITGPSAYPGQAGDEAAGVLNGFEGVALDAEAEADAAEDNPDEAFVTIPELGDPYRGELTPPAQLEDFRALHARRAALDPGRSRAAGRAGAI